jgi:hypothetical protein
MPSKLSFVSLSIGALLMLSAISTIGLGSSSSVQAQSLQSNHNSNTTVSIVKNNATMDDVKQHLHTQLDGAIMAAQNNDTFGVLMGLGQITEGLAAINTPEYFLFEDSLSNNGTTLANTSETSAQPLKLGKNNNDYYIQASLNKLKE